MPNITTEHPAQTTPIPQEASHRKKRPIILLISIAAVLVIAVTFIVVFAATQFTNVEKLIIVYKNMLNADSMRVEVISNIDGLEDLEFELIGKGEWNDSTALYLRTSGWETSVIGQYRYADGRRYEINNGEQTELLTAAASRDIASLYKLSGLEETIGTDYNTLFDTIIEYGKEEVKRSVGGKGTASVKMEKDSFICTLQLSSLISHMKDTGAVTAFDYDIPNAATLKINIIHDGKYAKDIELTFSDPTGELDTTRIKIKCSAVNELTLQNSKAYSMKSDYDNKQLN